MRKKLVLFIIVMVTIVNLISGVFIFLNIQFMKIPGVSTKVDIVKVGSDEGVAEVSWCKYWFYKENYAFVCDCCFCIRGC